MRRTGRDRANRQVSAREVNPLGGKPQALAAAGAALRAGPTQPGEGARLSSHPQRLPGRCRGQDSPRRCKNRGLQTS